MPVSQPFCRLVGGVMKISAVKASGSGRAPSKRLCRLCRMIAVNQLNSVVFGVTQHQTVEQSKMTLAFG